MNKMYCVTVSAVVLHHEYVEESYTVSSFSAYWVMIDVVRKFNVSMKEKYAYDWDLLDVRVREILQEEHDETD